VLGFYDADVRRITCFPKGINFVAETLKVEPILVERIVRYHETAHAFHHLGVANMPANMSPAIRMSDDTFRMATDESKEQIAQLATLIVMRSRRQAVSGRQSQALFDIMLEAFFTLMQRQSSRYQLPSKIRDVELSRLRDKLRLLLDMSDACMSPSADHIRRMID
jgi:hypothetical protein